MWVFKIVLFESALRKITLLNKLETCVSQRRGNKHYRKDCECFQRSIKPARVIVEFGEEY